MLSICPGPRLRFTKAGARNRTVDRHHPVRQLCAPLQEAARHPYWIWMVFTLCDGMLTVPWAVIILMTVPRDSMAPRYTFPE